MTKPIPAHVHEPLITLDGLIKCQTCGEFIDNAEIEITKANSYRDAMSILHEIAVAGHYTASHFESGFIVFTRHNKNAVEEITCQRLSSRSYRVIKKMTNGGDE